MVRHYVRKSHYNNYDVKTIISALRNVKAAKRSMRQIARDHNMKMSALSYHWKRHNKENEDFDENNVKKSGARIFSDALEQELLSYVITCADVYTFLGATWIRKLAYDLAIANNVPVPQSWILNEMAGGDWLVKFKERHMEALTEQIPESTNLEQIIGVHRNKEALFNVNYARLLAKYQFQPNAVYVLEQCKVLSESPDVIDLELEANSNGKQRKPKKAKPRAEHVTFVGTISALGHSIPPYYIFSQPRYQNHQLLLDAPNGSKGTSDPTGSMTKQVFPDYLEHVANHIKCNDTNPALLLIDDDGYHISLTAIKFAKENGIVILTLPPSTTNKLQHLDHTMFESVKAEIEDIKTEEASLNLTRHDFES